MGGSLGGKLGDKVDSSDEGPGQRAVEAFPNSDLSCHVDVIGSLVGGNRSKLAAFLHPNGSYTGEAAGPEKYLQPQCLVGRQDDVGVLDALEKEYWAVSSNDKNGWQNNGPNNGLEVRSSILGLADKYQGQCVTGPKAYKGVSLDGQDSISHVPNSLAHEETLVGVRCLELSADESLGLAFTKSQKEK